MGTFNQVCPTGNTMDHIQPPETVNCPNCGGDGEVPKEGGAVLFDNEIEKVECKECQGSGRVGK